LDDDEFVNRTRKMVEEGLKYLGESFDEMGLSYVPSVTNFILVNVGRGRQIFQELQRKKVIVRPMDSYGLPDYVRVTVGLQHENERFIHALGAVLRGKGSEKL
jgi:histidinol-phosphate aminotransferase